MQKHCYKNTSIFEYFGLYNVDLMKLKTRHWMVVKSSFYSAFSFGVPLQDDLQLTCTTFALEETVFAVLRLQEI